MKKQILLFATLLGTSLSLKAQTPQLININQEQLSSDPTNITEFNGKLYFSAQDGASGYEPMEYDNSKALGERVSVVKDIRPGSQSSYPSNFAVVGGKLYFTATSNNGANVFEYDGTNPLKETPGASVNLYSQNSLVEFKGKLFYGVSGGLASYQTNDTETEFISAVSGVAATDLIVYNDTLYFVTAPPTGSGYQLWKYDGANNPTAIDGTLSTSGAGKVSSPYVFAGKLLFSYSSDGSNSELYAYDDANSSVIEIADLNNSTGTGTNPSSFIEYNGKLYFKTANVAGLGSRIFSYDGTNAPVDVLGLGYLSIYEFEVFNNKLYFTTLIGSEIKLLSYDGTSVSSALNLGNFKSPSSLEVVGSSLYFRSFSDDYGIELAKYDGANASIAEDVNVGDLGSNPTNFTEYKGNLYFSANGSLHHYDGDVVTPYIDLFPFGANTTDGSSVVFHDSLFFSASGKLYKTDGLSTPDEITTPDATFTFNEPVVVGNTLFFRGRSSTVGEELFMYDGSTVSLVADLKSGSSNFVPRDLTNVNGTLVFTSLDDEIWIYTGTEAPYKLPMSKNYKDPESLIAYKNNLYFSADVDFTVSYNGQTQTQTRSVLMRSNSGLSAPVVVDDMVFGVYGLGIYKNLLVFSGYEFIDPFSPSVDLINFYNGSSYSEQISVDPNAPKNWNEFAEVNDTLYFRANDGNGYELWRYVDNEGFELVADILAGSSGSFPLDLYDFNNTLVFSAETENKGYEFYYLGEESPLNGLNDLFKSDDQQGLNIYPNPASSIINTEVGQLDIFDILGNRVLSTESTGKVDVSNLEPGIYFVTQNHKRTSFIIE